MFTLILSRVTLIVKNKTELLEVTRAATLTSLPSPLHIMIADILDKGIESEITHFLSDILSVHGSVWIFSIVSFMVQFRSFYA